MDRTLRIRITINQQKISACVVLVCLLVGFCPIRAGIKNLIGIPVNTEQSVPKNIQVFLFGVEKCWTGEATEMKVCLTHATHSSRSLLVVFLVLPFICLPGFLLGVAKSYSRRYGSLKIPGRLPFFIQYRKLII